MKEISKKIVLVLLVAALVMCAFGLIACDPEQNNGVKPQSISITTKGFALTKGTYAIEAKVLPAEADQGYSVSLKDSYTGISVDGKNIIVGEDAVHESSFYVVVTSTADESIVAEKSFIVDNPPPIPGVAITNSSLNIDITDGTNTYEIITDVSPKGTPVTVAIKETVDGVTIGEDGIVTIDTKINNKTTFIAVATAQIDGQTLKDEKQFTIINEVSRPISSAAELRALWVDAETSSANLNNFYHLTNDIDLNNEQWYQFMGYTDDASVRHGYAGTFDGRGYAIRNYKWENAGWNAGFFFQVEGEGKICNLGLYGEMTTAGGCCGAISGYMFGTIQNLFVDVDITQTSDRLWVGALYGASKDAANGSKIINCLSVGTVITGGKSGLIGSVNYDVDTVFTKSFALAGTVSAIVGENLAPSVPGYAEILGEAALKTAATYEGWDTDVWFIKNGTYPLLKNATFVEPDLPDYEDVVITNTNEVKEFDYSVESQRSFSVTCTTEPASAQVVYALDNPCKGVSIDEQTGVVTLSAEVNNKAKFTVVISAKDNPYSFIKVDFVVTNDIVREISTVEQLMELSGSTDILYNNYKLMANIVLTENFKPIGTGVGNNNVDDGFHGVFDGNGYTISNFNMTSAGWNGGFFHSIASTGVVKNLGLIGGETGVQTIIGGSLAGFLWGTVENCFVDVDVFSNHASQPSGGLVGTAAGDYVIKNTIYLGSASVSNPDAANGSGFIGSGAKTGIENSFVLSAGVDGVVGAAKVGDENEENCMKTLAELMTAATYAEWDTTNVWFVVDGNLPMLRYPGFVEPSAGVTITNTTPSVNVTEGDATLQMTHSVFPSSQGVVYSLKEAVEGVSITEEGLVTVATSVKNNVKFVVVATAGEVFDEMEVVVVNTRPVQISTVDDLKAIANDLTGNYILMNDIDLENAVWTPIGHVSGANANDQANAFKGVLDGNGYTISGLNVTMSWNAGFIWIIGENGVVKNLGLEGSVYSNFGGAFTGNLRGGRLENCFANVAVGSYNKADRPRGTLVGAISISGGITPAIVNCLAIGQGEFVEGSAQGVGLVGSGSISSEVSTKSIIQNSFVLNTSVEAIVGEGRVLDETAPVTSIAKTIAELKTAATYAGWDATIWFIADGIYPILRTPNFVEPSPSVEITNSEESIDCTSGAQTLQMTHSVYPTSQAVVYSLKSAVEGVSISESGLLSIAATVANGTTIVVVATAGDVKDEHEIEVIVISASIEITTSQSTIDCTEGEATLQITHAVTPADQAVVYSLKSAVEGISVSESGLVTVAAGTRNNVKFIVVATAGDLSDEMEITVVNTTPTVIEIKTVADLKAIADDLTGSYILANDINLNGSSSNKWTPIAGDFTGVLDGNGYTISGLYVQAAWNAGLFSKIAVGGTVKNLGLQGTTLSYCGAGLAGYIDGTVTNCFFDVAHTMGTGKNQFIGVIGGTVGSTANISYCISIGVGAKNADQKGETSNETDYSTSERLPGLIGTGSINSVTNCFILEGTTLGVVGLGSVGAGDTTYFKTEAELKAAATYAGWDTDVWNIADGSIASLKKGGNADAGEGEGEGEVVDTNVYITDVAGLKAIANDLTKTYVLMANINLNGSSSNKWTPIAGDFTGVLDGNGYTISGLYIQAGWNLGLFSKIAEGGVVKNLGLEGVTLSYCGGGLAGYIDGTVTNCFFDVAHTMGTGKNQFIGAIGGTVGATASISNCISIGIGAKNADQKGETSDETDYSTSERLPGLIGTGSINSVTNCFILEGTTLGVVGLGSVGAGDTTYFKTEAELKAVATYAGWDANVWNIVDGSIPTLKAGCTKAAQ